MPVAFKSPPRYTNICTLSTLYIICDTKWSVLAALVLCSLFKVDRALIYWAEKVVHFFQGLFSSDILLSDLLSVLLSAFFSIDFVFSAWFSAIVALASPTRFVLSSRDRVFSHWRVIFFVCVFTCWRGEVVFPNNFVSSACFSLQSFGSSAFLFQSFGSSAFFLGVSVSSAFLCSPLVPVLFFGCFCFQCFSLQSFGSSAFLFQSFGSSAFFWVFLFPVVFFSKVK